MTSSEIRLLHVEPGAFSLLEWRTPANASAPPLHLHRHTDEAVYVVSGRLATDVDGERTTHEAGSFAFIRRGQTHTFWNPGDRTATYLALITPAGLEGYFAELAAGFAAARSPEQAIALRNDLSTCDDVEMAG